MYKCLYIYIDIYHRSTPQANWPKIFEKLVARLPGCPPFTHLKGRQNRILGARPRLYATVVIANKKGRWFSKQCFGQMIICIIYIWIIYHPSLLPSKLWGSCCSHIFCIGQETSQTEPLPKGGQSIDVQTLMKKARPWHLFRHFSTKRPTPAPNRPQPTKKSIPFRFRTGAALGLVPLFWASLPAKPSGRW